MQDLNAIHCFVKTVQLKSITAAAKALGVPKSSVSRKISGLEKELGTGLLIRTTRSLNLTEAGQTYFGHAVKAMENIESAQHAIDTSRQTVQGNLRITAPIDFSVGPLPKLVGEFLKRFPLVNVELMFSERVVDLVGENIDLAFRIGTLKDSTLIARKLMPLRGHIVASSDWLKTRGEPRNPQAIQAHECLNFTPGGQTMKWTLKGPNGRVTLVPKSRFAANHMFALKQATIDGLGFAVIPASMIVDELANQTLKIVCANWELQGGQLSLVYPNQKFLPPKLRYFIDFAVAYFGR